MKGIQLSFTNGIESPLFETENGSKLPLKEIDVDISKRIARLGIYVSLEHKTKRTIKGIQMLGAEGQIVKNKENTMLGLAQ